MKKVFSILLLSMCLSLSAQVTSTQLKSNIDINVTGKTAAGSITPNILGNQLKALVDYAVQQDNLKADATATANGLNALQTSIDAGIAGIFKDAGNYDASVGTYPTTTNAGAPIEAGHVFTVSTAGTLGGVSYVAGEAFRSLVNTPGQTAANWKKLIYVSGAATTSSPGILRRATPQEVTDGTGDGAISATQLKQKIDALPAPSAQALTYGSTTPSGTVPYPVLINGLNECNGAGSVRVPDATNLSIGHTIYTYGGSNYVLRSYDGTSKLIQGDTNSMGATVNLTANTMYKVMFLGFGRWQVSAVNGNRLNYNGTYLTGSSSTIQTYTINATTAPLTLTYLNTNYGLGWSNGLMVICANISGGGKIYLKTDSGWYDLNTASQVL